MAAAYSISYFEGFGTQTFGAFDRGCEPRFYDLLRSARPRAIPPTRAGCPDSEYISGGHLDGRRNEIDTLDELDPNSPIGPLELHRVQFGITSQSLP